MGYLYCRCGNEISPITFVFLNDESLNRSYINESLMVKEQAANEFWYKLKIAICTNTEESVY